MTKTVNFQNEDGFELHGKLHEPEGASLDRGTVLFAHCFTCTANSLAAATISARLAEAGFRVLRFDFTGLGESGGAFADANFSSSVTDLIAAARYLAELGKPVDMLIGHSLGGTAALHAAPEIPTCRAVATIAAPATAAHVMRLISEHREEIEKRGAARVSIGGRPFDIKKQFIEDVEAQPPVERLRALRLALLVMHAPLDDIVEIANASEIFGNALHPKSFVSLDGANHLLTDRRDATYAADVIAAWSRRYLESSSQETGAGAGSPDDWVRATTSRQGFRTDVLAKGHSLTADEPTNVGGSNLGPSPYDLLSAALATCTSMTLQMYARHKGLKLDEVTTAVRHSREHLRDCEDCAESISSSARSVWPGSSTRGRGNV
jgi:alpha-beta hydrolase superfamily lysophospholipase/organic hydroperoxide reductase OsmC/OhrA